MTSTPERVVAATARLLRTQSLSTLTVEAVAASAGVSRQTVYRHFGDRGGLIEALVLHEEQELTRAAELAVEGAEDLEEAILRATTTLLKSARAHPLIDRLLASDPGELLPLLASRDGPVMSTAGPIVQRLLSRFVPSMSIEDTEALADLLSRLVISYTIAPSDLDPEDAAELITALVMGRFAQAPD